MRTVFFWKGAILAIFLFCASAFATEADRGLDQREAFLNARLGETSLSKHTKMILLRYYLPWTLTVRYDRIRDMARLDPRRIFVFHPRVLAEVEGFLIGAHLRMGITDDDMDHFVQMGRLPSVTASSDVYYLGLHFKTADILRQVGVNTVADLRSLPVAELRQIAGLGPLRQREVLKALADESVATQEQESAALIDRWSELDRALPDHVLWALRGAQIETWEQLRQLDLKTLKTIPLLGQQGVLKVRQLFEIRGQRLYVSALERARETGASLDLVEPIFKVAQISARLRTLLKSQGIECLNDLMDRQKRRRAQLSIPDQNLGEFEALVTDLDLALKKIRQQDCRQALL